MNVSTTIRLICRDSLDGGCMKYLSIVSVSVCTVNDGQYVTSLEQVMAWK